MDTSAHFPGITDTEMNAVLTAMYNGEREMLPRLEEPQYGQVQLSLHFKLQFEATWITVASVESGKKSKGVFATCDIPAGNFLTFFPLHYLRESDGRLVGLRMTNSPQERLHVARLRYNDMEVFGNTLKHDNLWFVGHMINKTYVRHILDYLNAEFVVVAHIKSRYKWVAIRAVRPISAGEEVLVPDMSENEKKEAMRATLTDRDRKWFENLEKKVIKKCFVFYTFNTRDSSLLNTLLFLSSSIQLISSIIWSACSRFFSV